MKNGHGNKARESRQEEAAGQGEAAGQEEAAGQGEAAGQEEVAGQGEAAGQEEAKGQSGTKKEFDVLVLNEKISMEDLVSEVKEKGAYDNIEYIQPDYELALLSDDTYFPEQWGVQNSNITNGTDSLSPGALDLFVRYPGIIGLLSGTSIEQLREWGESGEAPENVPPEIIGGIFGRSRCI